MIKDQVLILRPLCAVECDSEMLFKPPYLKKAKTG